MTLKYSSKDLLYVKKSFSVIISIFIKKPFTLGPQGNFAVKVLNLTSFSELKNNFENYCSSIKSENCINLNGFKSIFKYDITAYAFSGFNSPYIQ